MRKKGTISAGGRRRRGSIGRIVDASPVTEVYELSPGGNLRGAAGDVYRYENPNAAQAVTRVESGGAERALSYDADGWLQQDLRRDASTVHLLEERRLRYDASGCLREVESTHEDGTELTTSYVCGQGGRRVLRKTVDERTGATERVIQLAGLAEIRPDEGVVTVRLTLGGATVFEDVRELSTGQRIEQRSRFLHKDLRGSVLAQTAFDGSAALEEAVGYDPWGQMLAVGQQPAPLHAFVDHEPDPVLGYYGFGARVYDPSLRRWLSPDPLLLTRAEADTATGLELNLYSYARNNPVRYVDPTGLTGDPATMMVGGASGGLMTGAALVTGAGVLLLGYVTYKAYEEPIDNAVRDARDAGVRATQRFGTHVMATGGDGVCQGCDAMVSDAKKSQEEGASSAGSTPAPPPEEPDARTGSAEQDDTQRLSPEEQKSLRSLRQRLREHEAKLDAYRRNPDAFDNKGYLRNAPSPEVRKRIIEGRIKHLEGEIQNFRRQIESIGSKAGGK